MIETLITSIGGYSIARILFTISVIVLMGTFFSMVLLYLIELFLSNKRRNSLIRTENTLGLIFLTSFSYIGVAILLHLIFKIPL